MSIRSKQKAAIKRMLCLNEDTASASKVGVWKVLIYDKYCQEMLSPLIDVSELRNMGITLHMLIDQKRERVPDVPAIYFVQPTQKNIDTICRDCAASLYDSVYMNFSSTIPRPLLETLAKSNIASKTVRKVTQVHDQYAEFVSLEPELITLNHNSSFFTLNNPADETRLLSYIDELVDSLFCVVVTMGQVPVIRCKAGNAAEMVAEKLNKRLWEHLRSRNNLFMNSSSSSSFQRPLLVLADRSMDLAGPLHHAWTYQALCNDLLTFKSNRCTVPADESEQNSKAKTYDFNSKDAFWVENAGKPFPKVAEAVELSLKDYKREMEEMNKRTGMHRDPTTIADKNGGFLGNTDALASAINSLPALQRKKEVLDMHTMTATAILKELKLREIDAYFSLEEDNLAKAAVDKTALLQQLGPEGKGTPRDKLRLLLINFLCTDGSDLDELIAALDWSAQVATAQAKGQQAQLSDTNALEFLKQFKFLHKLENTMPTQQQRPPAGGGGMLGNVINSVYGQSVTGLTGLLAGVKNLLPQNANLPLTRMVADLMENKPVQGAVDKYIYLDPKGKSHKRLTGMNGRHAIPFKDATVFVLGGGNFVEYQNLRDYAAKTPNNSSITYGSTELLSSEAFLEQLARLGTPPATAPGN